MQTNPTGMQLNEHDKLMNLLEKSFGNTKLYFAEHFSQVQKKYFIPENHFIIKHGSDLVSHVGVYPMTAVMDNCKVKVGGIGDVATDPACRGNGCMGNLLNFSMEKMREAGIPLSILWGDTNRYRHYGWERFGRDMIFYLNQRSVKGLNPGIGFSIRGYDKTKKDLDKIISLHEKEPLRIARSRKDYERILNKPYVQVWLGEENSASAYMILRDKEVVELGGETSTILKMLSFILNNHPIDNLKLHLPFRENELLDKMYKISSGWELACLGMSKRLVRPIF